MVSCGISTSFPVLFPTERKVAHALLTRPPLKQSKASFQLSPLDLHVLGTPPAFVLSQDQTLAFNPLSLPVSPPARLNSFGITVSCLRYFCSVSFSRFSAYPSALRPRESACISYQTSAGLSTPILIFFHLFLKLSAFPNTKTFSACILPSSSCIYSFIAIQSFGFSHLLHVIPSFQSPQFPLPSPFLHYMIRTCQLPSPHATITLRALSATTCRRF